MAGPTGPGDGPGFRNSRWDRAALAVTADPSWLLAPLYVREVAGLQPPPAGAGVPPFPGPLDPRPDRGLPPGEMDARAASSGWPGWWSGAMSYQPGTPAPRVSDLTAGCPALQVVWELAEPGFSAWQEASGPSGSSGPADSGAEQAPRRTERDALAGFAARNGRDPGRWVVRILQIPVAGHYLCAPDERRIVVSAALRHDPDAYPAALAAELPRHF